METKVTIQTGVVQSARIHASFDLSKKLHALYRGDYDDSLALPLNHSDLDAACVVKKARGRGEKKLDCIEGKTKVDIAPAMTRTDRFARWGRVARACPKLAERPRRKPNRLAVVLHATQWFQYRAATGQDSTWFYQARGLSFTRVRVRSRCSCDLWIKIAAGQRDLGFCVRAATFLIRLDRSMIHPTRSMATDWRELQRIRIYFFKYAQFEIVWIPRSTMW